MKASDQPAEMRPCIIGEAVMYLAYGIVLTENENIGGEMSAYLASYFGALISITRHINSIKCVEPRRMR